jgi:uncharacterized protein (DUF2252 family)
VQQPVQQTVQQPVRAASGRPPAQALDFIAQYDRTLNLTPTNTAGKHAGMREAALGFYRATPSLFAHDVKGTFAAQARLPDKPAPTTTILVDPHLGNFGTLRGPDGKAVWGVNGFDQAAKGSPEFDLERLASSVVLEARARGLAPEQQKALVGQLYTSYAQTVHSVATGQEPGHAWLKGSDLKGAEADLTAKADGTKRKEFLAKYVKDPDNELKFKNGGELRKLDAAEEGTVKQALAEYSARLPAGCAVKQPLEVLDTASKLGGGSSYGLPRYLVLAKNAEKGKAPILLELKAAPPSPLVDPAGNRASFNGKAVADAQAAVGGKVNPLFGYANAGGQSLMVRELEPERGSVALDTLSAKEVSTLVGDAARVLARAHAADPATASKLDGWLQSAAGTAPGRLTEFAVGYADQTEKDFAAFKATNN